MAIKRITYYTKQGTIYSEIDQIESDQIKDGDWHEPFPNEIGNSTAFGLIECLARSDFCPLRLRIEGVYRIKVETLVYGNTLKERESIRGIKQKYQRYKTMITVTKIFEFEAAHYLPNYPGNCRNIHGHSYKLEVEVSGYVDNFRYSDEENIESMVVDFKELKKIVKKHILDKYDHSYLNDFFSIPTAEAMVETFVKILACYFKVERVRLWETSSSYAEWKDN